jgi:hypothetical protein
MSKLDRLLEKALEEFNEILEDFEYGRYPIDYSFLFEELQFMKLLDTDCIKDSYFNSILEYFLNNGLNNTTFQQLQ